VRYLILSDIHANWEALEAVLADARGGYGEILCCGDLVDYGAEPERIVEWARDCVELVVRGNHDRACAGYEDLDWFNPAARAADAWTRSVLTPGALDYLRALPKGPVAMDSFQLLHGSPQDEDEYLVTPQEAARVAQYLDRPISFFGHTHLQGGFLLHRNGVKRLQRPRRDSVRETLALERDALYLINPGSVGQPRDRDPRAAYLIYDSEDRVVEFRRAPYDIARAQGKIIDAGLPDMLAYRLETGS